MKPEVIRTLLNVLFAIIRALIERTKSMLHISHK